MIPVLSEAKVLLDAGLVPKLIVSNRTTAMRDNSVRQALIFPPIFHIKVFR
jgi:hypothetical protein